MTNREKALEIASKAGGSVSEILAEADKIVRWLDGDKLIINNSENIPEWRSNLKITPLQIVEFFRLTGKYVPESKSEWDKYMSKFENN